MDGTHDLGGKQGFGPIPIADNQGFHHDWQRRMWAIARAGILPPGTTIDWFRHGLERMVPSDYLALNYFNKWCANYAMLYVDAGTFSMDEILSGHPTSPAPAPAPLSLADVLTANRAMQVNFKTDTDTAARFTNGDQVTTKRRISASHTRLPGYARAATGTVISHHGAHLMPDSGASGIQAGEHLYTVSFKATELWGPDAAPRDTVTLDLWESYFV